MWTPVLALLIGKFGSELVSLSDIKRFCEALEVAL